MPRSTKNQQPFIYVCNCAIYQKPEICISCEFKKKNPNDGKQKYEEMKLAKE